jgi:hypothetical protein
MSSRYYCNFQLDMFCCITALIIICESPSTSTMLYPCSTHNLIPLAIAQASASLLVAIPILPAMHPNILPSSFLIIPPYPAYPGFPFAAPSKLSLTHPFDGSSQTAFILLTFFDIKFIFGGINHFHSICTFLSQSLIYSIFLL